MNEKKNHFIMKNEKFYGTEPKGYCPFEQAVGALGRWGVGALGRGRWASGRAAGAGRAWARGHAAAGGASGRLGERQ